MALLRDSANLQNPGRLSAIAASRGLLLTTEAAAQFAERVLVDEQAWRQLKEMRYHQLQERLRSSHLARVAAPMLRIRQGVLPPSSAPTSASEKALPAPLVAVGVGSSVCVTMEALKTVEVEEEVEGAAAAPPPPPPAVAAVPGEVDEMEEEEEEAGAAAPPPPQAAAVVLVPPPPPPPPPAAAAAAAAAAPPAPPPPPPPAAAAAAISRREREASRLRLFRKRAREEETQRVNAMSPGSSARYTEEKQQKRAKAAEKRKQQRSEKRMRDQGDLVHL